MIRINLFESPICQCGYCNEHVKRSQLPPYGWNKFVHGHHAKGKGNPMHGSCRKGELNPFYNKHHSEETLKILSEISKGNKNASGKWSQKRRDSYKGEGNPFYNKHHTKEMINYFREINSGLLEGLFSIILFDCSGKKNPIVPSPPSVILYPLGILELNFKIYICSNLQISSHESELSIIEMIKFFLPYFLIAL